MILCYIIVYNTNRKEYHCGRRRRPRRTRIAASKPGCLLQAHPCAVCLRTRMADLGGFDPAHLHHRVDTGKNAAEAFE